MLLEASWSKQPTLFFPFSQPLGRRALVKQYLVAIDMEFVLGIGDVCVRVDSKLRFLVCGRFELAVATACLPLLPHCERDALQTLELAGPKFRCEILAAGIAR